MLFFFYKTKGTYEFLILEVLEHVNTHAHTHTVLTITKRIYITTTPFTPRPAESVPEHTRKRAKHRDNPVYSIKQ